MLAPVAAGIAAGIIGFLPLFISLRLARRSTSLSAMSAGLYGLAGTFCIAHCGCRRSYRVRYGCARCGSSFGVAEIVALIVSTSAYVVYKNVLAKRKK